MTPTDGQDPRRRLAQLMEDRQVELDLTWEEIARRAGMTATNLRRIRHNESALPRRTARKIERALEWQPGSVEGVLAGKEPVPTPEPEPEPADPAFELLREAHRIYTKRYGLDGADRLLEEHIRQLNAARDRPKSRTSEQPENH